MRILLDAGHYAGYNTSPANSTYNEGDAMWKLHLLLANELRGYGIDVITTRADKNQDVGLTARGQMAKGCDLLLSLHSNAVASGVDNDVDYPAAVCMFDDVKITIDDTSREIGGLLANVVRDVMGTSQKGQIITKKSSNDRNGNGLYDDEYYGVLHGAKQVGVPAVILEHSFHTNLQMTNWLLNDDNLQKLATAEAQAIAEFYEIKKSDITLSEAVQVLLGIYEMSTIQYLEAYRYGEALIIKLAQAYKSGILFDDIGLEQDTIYFISYYKYAKEFVDKFNAR